MEFGNEQPATANISAEERKRVRAQRNRESAEKSRVRRKELTAELERSVGSLRGENKELKAQLLQEEELLRAVREAVPAAMASSEASDTVLCLVDESEGVIEACKGECPRTFRKPPHSPEIELRYNKP